MRVLAIILALFFHFIAPDASAAEPSVIIVGAGISGILAAKTLHDAGVRDFLILEGTDRIGGRMCKGQFSGHTIELGANWLFSGGPKPNILVDIGKEIKLKTFYSDYENISSNTYKQEGGLYPKNLVEEIVNVGAAEAEFCANFSRRLSSLPGQDVDMSILAAQRLYSNKVPTTPLEMVIDFYYNDYEDAEPPKDTSLKHTYPRGESEDFGEDTYFVADPRGFESVVHYFANKFLLNENGVITDPRLKLNKVVREIEYTKTGVTMKIEDGSVYKSKYAILSVSLGVLQSDLISFKPTLPVWKKVAISDFNMAVYTKIFLKFPYTFWPIGPGTEFFLYAHENRGYYPIWQHLENEIPGSNILFVTVTNVESKRIEQQSDNETLAEIMAVLKKMFGNDIPYPEDILVPRWWSHRLYRGTYANWPSRFNEKSHDQLGAPIGPIYFTGEYLSSEYIGYVSGAYLEGIRTANDVINCIKKKSCRGFKTLQTAPKVQMGRKAYGPK
ncbi:polyamine oxidase 1-like [Tripterygium wilfordii]|uniref:polyamine oxidase 1-like n=1 Tax=Tripterygium wilfordii TaxID=458696 RepID=UPI0018F835C8|nr:polyamine oxidase 1-like [Tripterygium wilfordii]